VTAKRSGAAVSSARVAALHALLRPAGGDAVADGELVPSPFAEGLEPNDRALAERIYRGVQQNLRLIDHLLAQSGAFRPARTPMALRWLLRMAVYQKVFLSAVPDYAIVQQAVEQGRKAGGEKAAAFINGVLRRILDPLPTVDTLDERLAAITEGPVAPALRYSVPGEIATALAEAYGEAALEPILRAANEEATPVWLRVNRLRTDVETLRDSLRADGVETSEPCADGWVLQWTPGSKPPWSASAWDRGELTVQDLGAMLAAWVLAPAAGERVIDWCAAPGGKAGQLWELMGGRGELDAYESSVSRRAVLTASLTRLYGSSPGLRVLGAEPDGAADAVLVDVPCLALGLLRRHPEVRWDNRLKELPRMARVQESILEAAALRVKPGGRLLWVTCSPTRAENEDRIGGWLSRQTEFGLADAAARVPQWAKDWTQTRDGFLRTRPDRAAVDGFGLALMTRLR
jgi:16S rRNA (cytosine967-C5)-methyltransferase